MKLSSKFNLGQIVYAALCENTEFEVVCPDCLGDKEWDVDLPTKVTKTIPCQTCAFGYQGSRGFIIEHRYAAKTGELTIGLVRAQKVLRKAKTKECYTQDKIEYMCVETGIGSGTVWSEERLHSSQKDAMAAAEVLLEKRNKEALKE